MPTSPLAFRVWDSVGRYYPGNLTEYWINRTGEVCACAFSDLYEEEYDVTSPGLIVERFTGLTDKNGKDIYEGDVILSHNWDFPVKAVVCYADHGAYFAACDIEGYNAGIRDGDLFNQPGDPWMLNACEVVGNVHQNPKLLTL